MKLQTKLVAAFLAIVIFMGISQSLFLQNRIQSTFESYLEQSAFGFLEQMQESLELYYWENGSWQGVQEVYFTRNAGMGSGRMRGGWGMGMMMANADLVLLDLQGRVIADTAQTEIGEPSRNVSGKVQELMVGGEKVGTLVLYKQELQQLEEGFLKSSALAILAASLLAALLAALLSLYIARKITSPLRSLVAATKNIAGGKKAEFVDVSTNDEFQELGEAFNDMAAKLERNEQVRRALVADIAHELRTPLSILQGKLESIQEGAVEANEETVLQLTDEVYRLNRLVSDLQQLSLAEAGKLPLNRQPVQMRQLVQRICSHMQWLADEKGISLHTDRIPEEGELEIDADRMTQVIVNLLGNALRHAPENGRVEVYAEEDDAAYRLKVADNGPGIPEEALPFIFDRFYKRDQARSRNEGGTGLGLSIAKGFAEAHGGTLAAESEVGKGTVFTLTLYRSKG